MRVYLIRSKLLTKAFFISFINCVIHFLRNVICESNINQVAYLPWLFLPLAVFFGCLPAKFSVARHQI